MKRPNRYLTHEVSGLKKPLIIIYADGIYFISHVLKNRLTREIKSKEVE